MLERALNLLPPTTLAAAVTGVVGDVTMIPPGFRNLGIQGRIVVVGGGTTCKVYVQTSLDGGLTWFDIACLAFTTSSAIAISDVKHDIAFTPNYTPTDGALADNTVKDGCWGDRLRVKRTTTGTYTGASTIAVSAVLN